jgi:hypothetical protein
MALNPNKAPSLGFGIGRFDGPPELTPSEDVATRTISKRLGLSGFSHSFSHTTTADTNLLILTIHTEGIIDYSVLDYDGTAGTLIGKFGDTGNSSDVQTLVYAWTGKASTTANFDFTYDSQNQYFTQIAQNWKDINPEISSGIQLIQATGSFSDVTLTQYSASNDQGTAPNKMVCWHCVYDPRNAPLYTTLQTGWTEIIEDTTGPDNIGHAFLMVENTTLPLEPAATDLRIDWDFSSQESAGIMAELVGPPSTTNLAVTGFVPVIEFGFKNISPANADISVTTTTPSVLVSLDAISPAAADLQIDEHIPSAVQMLLLNPANDDLNITTTAPDAVVAHLKVPASVDLQLDGTVPILPGIEVPAAADLDITGTAPSLDIGINPLQGDVDTTGSAPFYGFGYNPAADDISIEQDKVPTLSFDDNRVPPVGDLAIEQDKVPEITLPLLPPQADLSITTTAPAISYATSQNLNLDIGQADLTIQEDKVPDVDPTGNFPIVEGMATDFNSTNVFNHDFTYPSGVASGDLIIVAISLNSSGGTIGYPSGFVQLDNRAPNSTVRGCVAYKWAAGTETGVDVITSTLSTESSTVCARISGADTGINPQISSATTSNSAQSSNPPNLAASPATLKNYLWMAALTTDSFENVTGPSNMTGTFATENGIDSADATVAMDSHSLRALSFDPTAFTWNTSEACYSWTLCVHPDLT